MAGGTAGRRQRVGLVTGAGSGIGRATARLLAAEGANVTVVDVDREGGEETVRLIHDAEGEADFQAVDVAVAAEVQEMIERIVSRHGRLDFAHNNAGICVIGYSVDTLPEDVWDRVIGINQKGLWLCMKYELAVMRRQRSGAIVNTSSTNGIRATVQSSPYTASKHAVVGLTLEAAADFAELGVRVNAVLPGIIDTPMTARFAPGELLDNAVSVTPSRRAAQPEEIASAVAWLLSDAASFVTGHAMVVDGGLTSVLGIPPLEPEA